MTQMEYAKKGKISDVMRHVASDETTLAEEIRERMAAGLVVIPKNKNREFNVKGIGRGLKTKVNANLGTSASHSDLEEELVKLDVAIRSGTDAVMDLSTGPDLDVTLRSIIEKSSVMVGTVPIYSAVCDVLSRGKESAEMTADILFEEIEEHAKAGVDFVTVHCAKQLRLGKHVCAIH